MRVIRRADYRDMPWANGKGMTVELAKAERDGRLLWRLSMATVAEDGPFSLFPGIARNLTVLDGPGFRLVGDGIDLACLPLAPVAFAGDVPVRAITGGAVSTDFNVMTAQGLPPPKVDVARGDLAAGGLLALFALETTLINGVTLGRHDLAMTEGVARIAGRVLAVRLFV